MNRSFRKYLSISPVSLYTFLYDACVNYHAEDELFVINEQFQHIIVFIIIIISLSLQLKKSS